MATPHTNLYSTYNVKDYGAIGDGITDDYDSFKHALDEIESLPDLTIGGPGRRGAVLYIPFGIFRLSQTLIINKSITIQGAGGLNNASILYLNSGMSDKYISGIAITQNAGVTIIRDIQLNGLYTYADNPPSDKDDHDKLLDLEYEDKQCGIIANATVQIESCYIHGFRNDGIHINTSGGGNCNSSQILKSWLFGNGRHGSYIVGGDSNAILISGVNCQNNKGFGIFDASFLGNTYIGCLVEVSDPMRLDYKAYKTTNANYPIQKTGSGRHVFIGCYKEGIGGHEIVELDYPTMVLGGHLATAVENVLNTNNSYPFILSNDNAISYFYGSIGTYVSNPITSDYEIQLRDSNIFAKPSSSPITLTLPKINPDPKNRLLNSGRPFTIKNIGTDRVYIKPHPEDFSNGIKIDDRINLILSRKNSWFTLISNESQWYMINKG